MNLVCEHVYVIPEEEGDGPVLKRSRVHLVAETGSNDVLDPCTFDFPTVDIQDFGDGVPAVLEEMEAILEIETPAVTEEDESLLQSKIISNQVMENYKRGAAKLKRDLAAMDFADHDWKIRSYDQHGMAVVKILCGECNKEIGGNGSEHDRSVIQNLFANFRKSHLQSAFHIKQWCKKRDISYSDHPKKEGNKNQPLILTTAEQRQCVDEGVSILKSVNDSVSLDNPPFVLIGDAKQCEFKLFWYKVRCKVDGEIMMLCPTKCNLRMNLENHLHGLTHTKCCEDMAAPAKSSSKSTALSTRKRGRPTRRSKSNIGSQPDLHTWYSGSSIADSRVAEVSQSSMHSDSILSLLCWGYWKHTIGYGSKVYNVDCLLNDPKPRTVWVSEPSTTIEFEFKNRIVVVNGCFRHVGCKWISQIG